MATRISKRSPRVIAKLGNMRKPQDFLVYSASDGTVIVQSDKSIGQFRLDTRKGVLNTKGCYFPHLSSILGAKPFEFPPEFVQEVLEVLPDPEGHTDLGGVIVKNSVEVI